MYCYCKFVGTLIFIITNVFHCVLGDGDKCIEATNAYNQCSEK